MDNASRRLNTFSNWPISKQVWPVHLANAGFIYTGYGTRVQCVSCGVNTSVDHWSMGEKPEVVHFRLNPTCGYLSKNLRKDETEVEDLCQTPKTRANNENQTGINILNNNSTLCTRVNGIEIYEDSAETRPQNATVSVQPSKNDDEKVTNFNRCPVYYNTILFESRVNDLQPDVPCENSYQNQNVFLNKRTHKNRIKEANQSCEQCSLYQRPLNNDDRTYSIVLPSSSTSESRQIIPNGQHETIQLPSNYSNKQETLKQWISNEDRYETRMPRTYKSLSNNVSLLDSQRTLFDMTNTLITQQSLAESTEPGGGARNNLQRNIALEKTNINTTISSQSVDVDQGSTSLAHNGAQQSTPQHDEPKFMFPNFRHFQERFISYRTWPSYTKQPPQLLAESGCFYTGENDVVRCFCCNLGLSEWSANDNPWIEHARHYPNCWFLLKQKGQEFIDSIQSEWKKLYKPKNPAFDDMTSRLATFDGWRADIEQTPQILADAGFFYTGETDVVRCHYCDGGLKNWEPGDIPWEEHARWFSTCKYLIKMKGFRYIESVKKKYERQLAPINTAAGLTELSGKSEQAARSELLMEIPNNPVITAMNNLKTKDPAKLIVINNELKSNLLCVICKKNEKCMLFTNCGHRVTCDQCCHSLDCCPHCKKKIKKVIRTFLS